MAIQLYCFGESGNSYKAALTLELAEVDWQPVYVDFFNGEARTEEFLALNEMGEVPVMIDGDITLTQSGVIQDYVSSKSGKLGGQSAAQRREILRWMFWDNHKMSSQAGNLRFLMNFAPKGKVPPDVIAFQTGRLHGALKVLDKALAGKSWLVGDRITLADIACCGYLFYEEPFNFDRTEYPNIDAWLDRIAAQPGWKHPYELMPGSPADRA
ncbi:MAG: glutathione S-transferase family protein [Marinosulfonomonas sp.]